MTTNATIREHSAGAETALAALVDDLLSRLRAGDNLDADQILADHPQFASRLRDILPGLRAMSELTTDKDVGSTPDDGDVSAANDVLAGVLGDFRILREIGRGGMGIVYEAIQTSLNRRVALKVLPLAAMLDPRHLQRFKNEAMAAASLDHPNIVEVHAVGCERGVHFYAMRYVEGQTLAAVIDGISRSHAPRGNASLAAPRREREVSNDCANRAPIDDAPELRTSYSVPAANSSLDSLKPEPSPPAAAGTLNPASDTLAAALSTLRTEKPRDFYRLVAELGIQAAEALDHAHQLGIIHRDIKPSNLMVESVVGGQLSVVGDRQRTTDHGQRTTPKLFITDFGLARIESDATLTMTGDLLGTLRYMSPEQAEGKSAVLNHRTDIYSLGITLYELLTLRPAFPAEDRQTLLKQIAEQEPTAPRSLNKSLPVDLETIVLKATAKDPSSRYRSARDLADDLGRFRNQQPVKAKRAGALELGRRWIGRHVALVTIAVAALGFVAVSGITALLFILRSYQSEAYERNRAESNLRLAADSVDKMMTRVASDAQYIGNVHRAEELISDATRFHERLLDQSDDPQFVLRAITTYRRTVWIRYGGGLRDKAEPALRRASELLTELLQRDPHRADYSNALGHNELELGRLLWSVGQHAAAEAPLRRAVAIFERLTAEFPDDRAHELRLAEALNELCHLHWHSGHLIEAERYLARAGVISTRLPSGPFDWHGSFYTTVSFRGYGPYEPLRLKGAILHNRALLAREGKDFDRALTLFDQAIVVQQSAGEICSTDPWVKYNFCDHYLTRAETLVQAGRYEEAALAVDGITQKFSWGNAYLRGAELLLICAESAARPSDRFLANKHKLKPAITASACERFRSRARELVEQYNRLPTRTSVSNDNYAWFLLTCPDESFRNSERALKIAKFVTSTVPERLTAWRTLSLAQYRSGEWEQADQALHYYLNGRSGNSSDATALYLLAMIQWQQGDHDNARKTYDRAAALVAVDKTSDPNLIVWSREAVALVNSSGESFYRAP